MKYTLKYLRSHPVAVHCPTLELFNKVAKILKVASRLRGYNWKYYGEECRIGTSWTIDRSQQTPYPTDSACLGKSNSFKGFEHITAEELLAEHGIYISANYEIY